MPGRLSTPCGARTHAKIRYRQALYLLIACVLAPATSGSLTRQNVEELSSPGVIQLVCKDTASRMTTKSLGTLLDLSAHSNLSTPVTKRTPDIAVVAAHGLSVDKEFCYVRFGDERLKISKIHKGTGGRLVQDWAVLTLERRFRQTSNRLWWHIPNKRELQTFVANDGEVLVMRHANGETGRACETHIPHRGLKDPDDQGKFIVANCTTFPGMSGAPVLASVGDSARVIGINIGRRWDLSLGEPEWLRAVNLIRVLDHDIENAIVTAFETAHNKSQND